MSFPNGVRLSDSIASKLIEGGFPSDLDGLRFSAALNIWEFVPFGGGGGGFWQELGRTTLGVAGDDVDVIGFPARRYLHILVHLIAVGGVIDVNVTFNNDDGANYAQTFSNNYAAGASLVNQTVIFFDAAGANAGETWIHMFIINNATDEKLNSSESTNSNAGGPGSAPNNRSMESKWTNVIAQITRIDVHNLGAGSYDVASEVVVLGSD